MPLSLRAAFRVAAVLGALGAPAAYGQTPTGWLPAAGAADAGASDGSRFAAGSAGPYAVTPADEPLLSPTAGWDQVPADPLGWFGAVTLGVVRPHVRGNLAGGPGLPFAGLDWTESPRVEVGYRLADGAGDLRLGYHLLAAGGTDDSVLGGLHSRVDVNALDLDYVSREWLAEAAPDLCRDLRAVAGVRLADATVKASGPFWNYRSEFVGAGPRFGLEWSRPLPVSQPLAVYVRAEGTGLVGQTRQTIGFAPAGLRPWNGAAAVSAEVGLGWRPLGPDGVRVLVGYQFEQWWDLGRTDAANVDLVVHGVFLRAEWRY